MADRIKLAVCCYCGSREAICLESAPRRKLACDACGAPLKQLKKIEPSAPAVKRGETAMAPAGKARRASAAPKRTPRGKKAPSVGKRFGAWLEDIADEIEDLFD